MKTVDAHDFLSRGNSYLHADQTLAVEQEGRTLGFYVPLPGAGDPSHGPCFAMLALPSS